MSRANPHHAVYYAQPPGVPLSSAPLQARASKSGGPAAAPVTQLPPPGMLYDPGPAYGSYAPAPPYNAVAGPSREVAAYAYGGVPRATPTPEMPHAAHGHAQHPAWSSVHPGGGRRVASQGSSHGGMAPPTVRLEDLVSSDAGRPGSTAPPAGLTSVPLNMAQPASSYDSRQHASYDGRQQSAGGDGGGGGGAGGGSTQQGPSEFIKKLYKMLEEEGSAHARSGARAKGDRGSVGWGRDGSSFVVWDMNDFTTKVLPQTFRHSNFSSFVRQLNKYGFSKIKHVDDDSGKIRENVWEFQHPNFQAGGKSDLESIKRKAVASRKSGAGGGPGEPGVAGDERDTSPAREDAGRLMDLETRVAGVMDAMHQTHQQLQEQLRDSRGREAALVSLMRDLINHVAATERETAPSPHPDERPTPRVAHLLQSLNHVTAGYAYPFPYPAPQSNMASNYVSPRTAPSSRSSKDGGIGSARPSPTHVRNMASGSTAGEVGMAMTTPSMTDAAVMPPPTATMPSSAVPAVVPGRLAPESAMVSAEGAAAAPALYNGGVPGMAPYDASWLGGASGGGAGGETPSPALWARRASDGTALRMMVEALSAQPQYAETPAHDSLDGSPAGAPALDADDDVVAAAAAAAAAVAAAADPLGAAAAAAAEGDTNGGGSGAAAGGAPAAGTLAPRKRSRSMFARPTWHHAPRVLVVEDDAITRRIAAKFLSTSGCIVESVENGQAAVDKVTTTAYDLVLMDIFLDSSMDGTQATSMIREFGNWTPIISMTTNNSEQDITKYRKSGMTDFLAKPLSLQNIFSMLEKHLRHLKAIALSGEVPRPVGIPPLNNTGVHDAIIASVPQYVADPEVARNPLAGIGYPDDQYHFMMQNLLANSDTFDPSSAAFQDAIGTNLVFGATAGFYAPATGQSGTFGAVLGANGVGAIGLGALGGAAGANPLVGGGAAGAGAAAALGLGAMGLDVDDAKRGIDAVDADEWTGDSPRDKKPRVGE